MHLSFAGHLRAQLFACLASASLYLTAGVCRGTTCDNHLEQKQGASLLQISSVKRSDVSAAPQPTSNVQKSSASRLFPSAWSESSSPPQATSNVTEEPSTENPWKHGLHRVVGADGVLMISLARQKERFDHSSKKLAKAGIYPTFIAGTDGKDPTVSQAVLDQACENHCSLGASPHARSISALADSHRRALVAAQQRSEKWTAILEDDVVPVKGVGTDWFKAFDSAWALLPAHANFVRLGRCNMKTWPHGSASQAGMEVRTYASGGEFRVTQYMGIHGQYDAGGCTHAYMIRKDFIPTMLSLFPCTCALDCCFAWKLFNLHQPNGPPTMFNIDTQATPDDAQNEAAIMASDPQLKFYRNIMQFGVLRQDWADLPDGTTRELHAGNPSFMQQGSHAGNLSARKE